jgi:hypothetical protein
MPPRSADLHRMQHPDAGAPSLVTPPHPSYATALPSRQAPPQPSGLGPNFSPQRQSFLFKFLFSIKSSLKFLQTSKILIK